MRTLQSLYRSGKCTETMYYSLKRDHVTLNRISRGSVWMAKCIGNLTLASRLILALRSLGGLRFLFTIIIVRAKPLLSFLLQSECFFLLSIQGCLPPPSPGIPRLPFTGVLSAFRQQSLPNLLSPTFASPKPVGTLDVPPLPPYSVHGEFSSPTLPFF